MRDHDRFDFGFFLSVERGPVNAYLVKYAKGQNMTQGINNWALGTWALGAGHSRENLPRCLFRSH